MNTNKSHVVTSESDWWNWKDDLQSLLIKGDHIEPCSASGAVDVAVEVASLDPAISDLVSTLGDVGHKWLADELGECGAWEEDELADREQNVQRIIWQVACEYKENRYEIERETSDRLASLGWTLEGTGGGCLAWVLRGTGVYWMLTDDNLSVDFHDTDEILLGEYDGEYGDGVEGETFYPSTIDEAIALQAERAALRLK